MQPLRRGAENDKRENCMPLFQSEHETIKIYRSLSDQKKEAFENLLKHFIECDQCERGGLICEYVNLLVDAQCKKEGQVG